MARQESYIRQLSVQLDEKLQKDQNFAVDAYDALQPYLTTSMAKGQLVNEAGRQRTTPGWTPSNRMAPIRSGGWLHGVLPGGCQPAAGGAAIVLRKS